MVFGFFEGNIDLKIDKTNYRFGETIQGKLNLKLKKQKDARQLRVRLEAVRIQRTYGKQNRTNKTVLFSTDTIVDTEKTYLPPGQEYDFQIQVPQKTALPPELGGVLGTVEGTIGTAVKTMQFLSGTNIQTKWHLTATLDIPKGIDINKSIQISVQ